MIRAVVTTDTLEDKLDKEFSGIFTGLLAKVESFNKQRRTAKVQPLAKIETSDGFKSLPVVTLPVRTSFGDNTHIIPNFKRGDIVILVGGLYPTTNSIKGNFEQDLSRKHSLENMVIIGGLYDSTSMNSDVIEDGLVICHEKSGARVVIKESQVKVKKGDTEILVKSSGVEITGDVIIKGNLEVDKEITWMKKTKPVKASKHIHPTPTGPSGVGL